MQEFQLVATSRRGRGPVDGLDVEVAQTHVGSCDGGTAYTICGHIECAEAMP